MFQRDGKKLMGSVSIPVETGCPVLGHSRYDSAHIWLPFDDRMTCNRETVMVNKWLIRFSAPAEPFIEGYPFCGVGEQGTG